MIVDAVEGRLSAWDAGDRLEELRALTLDIVARTLLGVDIEPRIGQIGHDLDVIFARLGSVWYHLLPAGIPTPGNRRFFRALSSLESVVEGIITDRRADPDGDDVVSRLLDPEFTDGEPMGTRRLRDEVVTFLVTGHETTAQALTFTCYLLATHLDIEARLVEELKDKLGGDTPSVAAIRDLTYTDRVIREALRLNPPASDIHRKPTKTVEIRGYDISQDATISMPPRVVHLDSRWYEDPDAFQPDRWTDEFRSSLPRLAYFPFGAGPRRCIGERFALMEAKIVLASLYQDVHLEVHPQTTFEVEYEITTRPKHPIWMTVTNR